MGATTGESVTLAETDEACSFTAEIAVCIRIQDLSRCGTAVADVARTKCGGRSRLVGDRDGPGRHGWGIGAMNWGVYVWGEKRGLLMGGKCEIGGLNVSAFAR